MGIQIRTSLVFFTLFLFIQASVYAQITLPKVFGDNMVLQRGVKIPVWGNSAPGAHITAELGKYHATATADEQGRWKVRFPVLKAGGPYELKISETGKPGTVISMKGILIGDVWFASGQSNMDMQVQQSKDARQEITAANYPEIRFLVVCQANKLSQQKDIAS